MSRCWSASYWSALLTIAMFALTGCAGRAADAGPLPLAATSPGMPALPAPAALAKSSQASFTEAGLMCEASDFAPALPSNLVTPSGSDAGFTPTGAGDAADLAYAVYAFDVDGYNRDVNLRLTWGLAPAANELWIALANFATNRWVWFKPQNSAQLNFSDIADFTSPAPGNALFAVVMLRGAAGATLDKLRIGAQPATAPPMAQLGADVTDGPAPLAVQFNAGASTATPPATITKYEFNFDDGAGFEDFGLTSTASHTYPADGDYTAQVRVTDVFGATDTRNLQITVGTPPVSYDEKEDNDTRFTANALAAFPFTSFTGNCGTAGAYDGDTEDFFWFNAAAGDKLTITINHGGGGSLDLYLYDDTGAYLSGANGLTSPDSFTYVVDPGAAGTLVLDVVAFTGSANYVLSGVSNEPTAALTVTPGQGAAPLNVVLDASASVDPPPGVLTYEFDPEGDGTFEAPQAGATLNHQYAVDGIFAPVVRITDDDGNIATATSIVLVGDIFDEVENNDGLVAAANNVTLPINGFRGSAGSGPGYPAYDGDTFDYYAVTNAFAPGQTITVQLNSNSATGDLDVAVLDRTGGVLATSSGSSDSEGTSFKYPTGSPPIGIQQPIHIRVKAVSGYSDYTLTASF